MAKPKSLYTVHPGVAMVQTTIARLKEKTGRTLDEWIALVNKSGPPTEQDRREWLKNQHNLGTNYSWWIAEQSVGKGAEETDPDEYLKAAYRYVEEMYAGGKAELRPIYDRLLALGLGLGKDVKACPCKTIVPLYRNHVFAQIKPSTRTRIDFGLALGATRGKGRLLDTGGFAKKDRITHRIAISSLAEIDEEVKRWLNTAYEMDE
jgi:hypothetical protein